MENTNKSIIDFGSIFAECGKKIFSEENIISKIEASLDQALATAIEDQFSRYGDTQKAIEKAIKESICVNLDLGLPSYNSVVAKLVKEKIETSIFEVGKKHIGAEIDKLLDMPPAEINLSEILEKFQEYVVDYNDDKMQGEYTCVVEETDKDGFYWVYLDVAPNTGIYQCHYALAVNNKGHIYSIKADNYGESIDTEKSKYHSIHLTHFEKLLFNLYACNSKIIDDCDGDYPTEYDRY
ncbi:MAG: hypothetical protein HRU28_08510 [Rhizobiales bacterium]|nr:hypothetical protein [Hyphomicrobiales bacterium]